VVNPASEPPPVSLFVRFFDIAAVALIFTVLT